MAPEVVVGGIVLVALVLYAITGGADFGGGVWDLLSFGGRARVQREAIAKAMGPIWEANHVWLILVIVLLFTCFPRAFRAISIALHLPLVFVLIGIVLRGTAFVFRSYDRKLPATQLTWSWVFAAGSIITPIMFGACIAALSTGSLAVDPVTGTVGLDFYSSWTGLFPWLTGLYTLALFAWLAAVYLTNAVDQGPVREDFRKRALIAGPVAGLLAFAVLGSLPSGAPALWNLVATSPGVWLFIAIVSVLAAGTTASVWVRRYAIARVLAAGTVALVVVGWGVAQFPVMVAPDLTLFNSAAPPNVLWNTVGILAGGSVVLVPSFVLLFVVFRRGSL